MKKDIFQKLLKEYLLKGEYGTIDDIFEYSRVVHQQLVDHFETEMQTNSLDQLQQLCEELQEVISRYKLVHLQDLLSTMELKLVRLSSEEEKERSEKRKRESDRMRQELESQQKARDQQWEKERKQREGEREQERKKQERHRIELEKKRMQREKQNETKPKVVVFEGLEIPEEWLTTRPLYLEYIAELSPMHRTALQIAMSHLKTSFDLERSNGFVEWCATKRAASASSESR